MGDSTPSEATAENQARIHPAARLIGAIYKTHGEPAARLAVSIALFGVALSVLLVVSWLIGVTNPPFAQVLRQALGGFWIAVFCGFAVNIVTDLIRWMLGSGDSGWLRFELTIRTRPQSSGGADSWDEAMSEPAAVYSDLGRQRPTPAVTMGEAFDITGVLADDTPPPSPTEEAARDWANQRQDIRAAARRFERTHSSELGDVGPVN